MRLTPPPPMGAPAAVHFFLLFPIRAKNHLKFLKKKQYSKPKSLALLTRFTKILGARLLLYPFSLRIPTAARIFNIIVNRFPAECTMSLREYTLFQMKRGRSNSARKISPSASTCPIRKHNVPDIA